jgi:hypothetical protein
MNVGVNVVPRVVVEIDANKVLGGNWVELPDLRWLSQCGTSFAHSPSVNSCYAKH